MLKYFVHKWLITILNAKYYSFPLRSFRSDGCPDPTKEGGAEESVEADYHRFLEIIFDPGIRNFTVYALTVEQTKSYADRSARVVAGTTKSTPK